MEKIQKDLFTLRDLKYAKFHSSLMPTVDEKVVIGVRTPVLRQYAKEISKEKFVMDFMKELPHTYYEENNLHGMLIELLFKNDIDLTLAYVEQFLPFVDNWATCDLMTFKIYKKYPKQVYERAKEWIADDGVYVKRYGIVTLMGFLDDALFKTEMLDLVANIISEEYYINMARAWYFSIALVKQYDIAIRYFTSPVMDKWTHNKSIQKAIESRRISDKTKKYLRTLKLMS